MRDLPNIHLIIIEFKVVKKRIPIFAKKKKKGDVTSPQIDEERDTKLGEKEVRGIGK